MPICRLTIARAIVDAHGGRIHAESDGAGRGARFVLELPASGEKSPSSGPDPNEPALHRSFKRATYGAVDSTGRNPMNTRSTFYVASGAAVIAGLALALAVVATVRAGDEPAAPSQDAAETTGMSGHSMGSGMSNMSGTEHGAAAPQEGVPNATRARGGRPLAHTTDGGTWVFRLTAEAVKWEILPGIRVTAWTYNGTVPGPEIRVPYGQKVRVVVRNNLPDPTTVHWHGIAVPNAMDGVPDVTQAPIEPGESFTYEFRAVPTAESSQGGTFMYHSHFDEDRQVGLGLSAPFVIEPPAKPAIDVERTIFLGEWNLDPEPATRARRCRWKARSRTTSRSTARLSRRPSRSTSVAASAFSCASWAVCSSPTRCTCTG
jgi:FtsP/CotA-like multicopper oxidase with cupredoxin domain